MCVCVNNLTKSAPERGGLESNLGSNVRKSRVISGAALKLSGSRATTPPYFTLYFTCFANAFVATYSSHLTALSSASWSISPWSANVVRGHNSTMWIIVCRSPHWHLSEEVRHDFCRLAAHNPVFVRKRFSNDHVRRGNSKPGCRTVGSDTSALLPTIAESQTSCHLVFISEVVKSNHSGFLKRNRAGW